MSTISLFTFASSRFGVLNPYCVSKPSTPRNSRSALSRRSVSSAIGPTSENQFLRRVPPVKMTSTDVPESSAAILTAFVMIVRL